MELSPLVRDILMYSVLIFFIGTLIYCAIGPDPKQPETK